MIVVNYEDCSGCGACVDACPVGAVLLQNDTISIDHDLCESCQTCVDSCSQGALMYVAVEPQPEKAILIPEPAPVEVISIQQRSDSESLRSLALPALSSVLLWTGREIIPRLADLALSYLDRRLQPSESDFNYQKIQMRGQRSSRPRNGRRRRQRQRRKMYK